MHEEVYLHPSNDKGRRGGGETRGRPVSPWARPWFAPGVGLVGGTLREGDGRTRIYITPGFSFKVVTEMFTNFHTPCVESSRSRERIRRPGVILEDVRGRGREAI